MVEWREAIGNLGSGFCFLEKETPPLRAKGMILGDRVLRDTHWQEEKRHGSPKPQRALSRDKNDTMGGGEWRNGNGCNGSSGQFDPGALNLGLMVSCLAQPPVLTSLGPLVTLLLLLRMLWGSSQAPAQVKSSAPSLQFFGCGD